VKTELVERYALEEKHYDRRQTRAQEEIARAQAQSLRTQEQISRKIGGDD
jgi:hypothetical protein